MQPAGAWLTQNADLLPARGRALDLACGQGRHAVWLAAAGLETRAVDRDQQAVSAVNETAVRLGLPLTATSLDLEGPDTDIGTDLYDVIVGVHYLHRPLFPVMIRALRPWGLLIYETFTVEQASRGRPKNPEFLLLPGELRRLVHPLQVLRYREGDYDDRMVASVVARKD